MFKEYADYDALGLAGLVARREVTPQELLDAALARAEVVNPKINAIIRPMHEIARARLNEPLAGPFAGVPFLIKDIVQDYAGVPTTSGSRALRNYVPAVHAEVVRRFLNAGVVIFGKTNTPELALKGVTEPLAYGPTRNPWDLSRTPGGSSGGSAAAVAAGIVPMAGGSDGGGSIRIPAACCGLFGLRPSRGRVPIGPTYGEFWEGASSEGVLTRSVRDTAAMLDAIHGADAGAPFVIAKPERSYLEEIHREPEKLKIAFTTRSPIDTPVDPECVRAVEETARLLESLGHRVEPVEPEIDGHEVARCFLTMYFGQTAAVVAYAQRMFGARASEFEWDTRALALLGRALPLPEYIARHWQWNDFCRALGRLHERYDLYMTPTLAFPPWPIGATELPGFQKFMMEVVVTLRLGKLLLKSGIVDQLAQDSLKYVPFTQLANLCGVPAMSVPLHATPAGLPVGVHFVARSGAEDVLLRLAAQLEHARPWKSRRPPI